MICRIRRGTTAKYEPENIGTQSERVGCESNIVYGSKPGSSRAKWGAQGRAEGDWVSSEDNGVDQGVSESMFGGF